MKKKNTHKKNPPNNISAENYERFFVFCVLCCLFCLWNMFFGKKNKSFETKYFNDTRIIKWTEKLLPQFVHELFLIWCAQWGKFKIKIYTMYVCWVIQKIYAICAAHTHTHI